VLQPHGSSYPAAGAGKIAGFFRSIDPTYTPVSIFQSALFLPEIHVFSLILPEIFFIARWWPVFQAAMPPDSLVCFSASGQFPSATKPVPQWNKVKGCRDALVGQLLTGKTHFVACGRHTI
jgi:hypothetical protein